MNPCVIDASVAAKWFFEEEYSENARTFMSDQRRHIAPDFIVTELASTSLKRLRRGQADADHVRIASARLSRILVLHVTPPLVPAALEIAIVFGRSVYDSLYLALASLLSYQLVTADRKLYNALTSTDLGAIMLWIEDVPVAGA